MKTTKGFLNGNNATNNRTSNQNTFADSWNSKRRHR